MLNRIVLRSLTRRRRRKLLSVLAVTLGIVVTTAVGTIALDVGDKVSRELRSYGANISVTPASESMPVAVGDVEYRPGGAGTAFLPESDLVKLKKIFWRNNIIAFAPFLQADATIGGRPAPLIGTWFEKEIRVDKSEVFRTGVRMVHPGWKVQGRWPEDQGGAGCLLGRRLAARLGVVAGHRVEIKVSPGFSRARPPAIPGGPAPSPGGAAVEVPVVGILETGGPEDDQALVPLEVVQNLAGLPNKVQRLEVSALTKPEDAFARSDVTRLSPAEFDRWYCSPYVASIAYQIQQAIPGVEAKPVYQVAATEGRILHRLGALMALLAAAALATAVLAVASMMFAAVLERRLEIGLFKSLGATDARVVAIFLVEACFIGLLGGVLGYFGGNLLARRLAIIVFGRPTSPHWVVFPIAVALALVVTLAGSALPLRKSLRISPAMGLRE